MTKAKGEDTIDFSERLRAARKAARLSQEELSSRLHHGDIHRIGRLERREAKPWPAEITKLEKILGAELSAGDNHA